MLYIYTLVLIKCWDGVQQYLIIPWDVSRLIREHLYCFFFSFRVISGIRGGEEEFVSPLEPVSNPWKNIRNKKFQKAIKLKFYSFLKSFLNFSCSGPFMHWWKDRKIGSVSSNYAGFDRTGDRRYEMVSTPDSSWIFILEIRYTATREQETFIFMGLFKDLTVKTVKM